MTIEHELNATTPMMQQYMQIKAQHKDYLLFYRMGDFYELFFEDAIVGSRDLDITLTKRGKHLTQDIPMCGVPFHSSEFYIQKLLKKGHSVAICEQIESPDEAKKRGYKAVVKREVIRIITPGTIMDEILLESKEQNNLVVIVQENKNFIMALTDISIGTFTVETIHESALLMEISRIQPKEIVLPDLLAYNENISESLNKFTNCITRRPDSIFDYTRCHKQLLDFYGIEFIDGIGTFSKHEVIAAGALIEYIKFTQKNSLPKLQLLSRFHTNNFMQIDPATRLNLEISRGIRNDSKSLLSVIDKTLTACGGRLLFLYLSSPLTDVNAINARLNNVEGFLEFSEIRRKVRALLKLFPDIERSLSRINANRFNIKELFCIRNGLEVMLKIADIVHGAGMPATIQSLIKAIPAFDKLFSTLQGTLIFDISDISDSRSVIRESVNPQLDRLYDLKNNSQNNIDKLRDKYRTLSGISTLRINKNNVLGYFIEVSSANASKVKSEIFKHKQSLGSVVRYTTEELQALETDIIMCDTKIERIEREMLENLYAQVANFSESISAVANAIAVIDVFAALAELAESNDYVKPRIDDSKEFHIVSGYHPMVYEMLKNKFIPNNCALNEDDLVWLITGPNMAGKSTFLRQNAIICILAQIGSFVPAKSAHIGIVNKLFSRIGASDNIASGQSTFMVEMLETAHIANDATSRSLIIMDEVGRGTSTYDGLAIAKSVVEYIHNVVGARMLFATHYHEMCELEDQLNKLSCHTMKVLEWKGKISFLHEVIAGRADKSYGVHVAQLAGMPNSILTRAYNILSGLENQQTFTMYDSAQSSEYQYNDCIIEKLDILEAICKLMSNVNINDITPRCAMNVVFELHELINNKKNV